MDECLKRLEVLEDRAEIADLIASYGPLADKGDGEALAQLWVEEGEYEIGGFGSIKGRADLAAMLEDRMS